ncbi:signal peptidase II [Mycoplasmopsis hyopharyngis]|uniref:signal peptidase II n=1 Tax=Mycoplasmopsis hyopharyngis TaxID=29558 RepID=UPI00387305B2
MNWFKELLKKNSIYWKENKKKIITAYLIFITIVISVVFIDQLTKILLFKWKEGTEKTVAADGILFDWSILGSRSVLHAGVTFVPNFHGKTALIQTLSIIVLLLLCALPYFFAPKKTIVILLAFMSGGNIGNMIDRFIYINGSVKDIFFVPFLERWINKGELGTFNFADVAIMGGSISMFIYFIVQVILNFNEQKKEEIIKINSKENLENDKKETNDENDEEQNKKTPPSNNLKTP